MIKTEKITIRVDKDFKEQIREAAEAARMPVSL